MQQREGWARTWALAAFSMSATRLLAELSCSRSCTSRLYISLLTTAQ